MKMQDVKLPSRYKERLTRNNLLIKGQDYHNFGIEDYISRLTNGFSKDLGEIVKIKNRKLSRNEKVSLIKRYSNQISYSTNR